jgi:anti-sigma28 factor (negative regulator of flagellin synthesis)
MWLSIAKRIRENNISTALDGQLPTMRTLSVLTSEFRISTPAPNDVRWEKVQQIKPNVSGGTYPVPPEQVATKLIEYMLDRGRAERRRKRNS